MIENIAKSDTDGVAREPYTASLEGEDRLLRSVPLHHQAAKNFAWRRIGGSFLESFELGSAGSEC